MSFPIAINMLVLYFRSSILREETEKLYFCEPLKKTFPLP